MKFLSLKQEIFGLDVNDLSLKIIKLKKKRRGFKLESYNLVEIEPGIIEEGVIKNEEAFSKIIKTACKTVVGKNLNTKYVVASLPEEKSFLQIIQMPIMKEEELKTAIFFEAENYIPLSINEVYLDFQVIPPIKEDRADHLNVLIVATPKKIVNSYVSCLKKAGLIPLAIEVEAEAVARALVKDEISTSPIVLLDFGKTNTDFIVFFGRSVCFTCSIQVSSHQLTKAIAEVLKIDIDKAEKIKMKYDLSERERGSKSKEIFKAMSPILNEMTMQIKKYLNFYQDHASHKHFFPAGKIEKIFICGGGSNLKGLAEFLSNDLGLHAEVGNFWLNFLSKKQKKDFFKNILTFTTAIGLALKKTGGPFNFH
jgi:type IV pilus assembly protein PilM